jgi:hypothetical protein
MAGGDHHQKTCALSVGFPGQQYQWMFGGRSRDPFLSGRRRRNIPLEERFMSIVNLQRKENMRIFLAIASAAAMASTFAVAQPANRDANTPAVNAPNSPPNPGAPVAGANSFTEGQAKSRIESHGFASVSDLRKDDQGVWRGKAMKDGKSVSVSLDFQGNVTAQ